MLEFVKTLFDSGYKWISKCYVSSKRFICKYGCKAIGQAVLLIAKILIEKLIEELIEHFI